MVFISYHLQDRLWNVVVFKMNHLFLTEGIELELLSLLGGNEDLRSGGGREGEKEREGERERERERERGGGGDANMESRLCVCV